MAISTSTSTLTNESEPSSPKPLLVSPDKDGKLRDQDGNIVGWSDLYIKRFPEKHSWLAVYFSPFKRKNLTHADLLTLLFCMV